MMKKILKGTSLVILVSFAIIELTVRLFFSPFDTASINNPLYTGHPRMMVQNKRNASFKHSVELNGSMAFKSKVETDEFGRRITPISNTKERNEFIIVLGSSVAFGLGLEQDETLAYYLGNLSNNYTPYNYAISATGPQNILAMFESYDLNKQVKESNGTVIYVAEINRSSGHIQLANTTFDITTSGWLEKIPAYKWMGQEFEFQGTQSTFRPVRYKIKKFLHRSHSLFWLYKKLKTLNDKEVLRFANFVEQIKKEAKKEFPESEFFLVASAFSDGPVVDEIIPVLEKRNINFLDLSDMLNGKSRKHYNLFTWSGTPHPNAKLTKMMAQKILLKLSLIE